MDELNQNIEELKLRRNCLLDKIAHMRKRRYMGMDDDVAEDIVEELYRELLIVEKLLNM